VSVCHQCFKIYTTIDRARDALAEANGRDGGGKASPSRPQSKESVGKTRGGDGWIGDTSFEASKRPRTPPISGGSKATQLDQSKGRKVRAQRLHGVIHGTTKLPRMNRTRARALRKQPGVQTLGALDSYLRNNTQMGTGNQEDDEGGDNGDPANAQATPLPGTE
jgi:hypothetical protein